MEEQVHKKIWGQDLCPATLGWGSIQWQPNRKTSAFESPGIRNPLQSVHNWADRWWPLVHPNSPGSAFHRAIKNSKQEGTVVPLLKNNQARLSASLPSCFSVNQRLPVCHAKEYINDQIIFAFWWESTNIHSLFYDTNQRSHGRKPGVQKHPPCVQCR